MKYKWYTAAIIGASIGLLTFAAKWIGGRSGIKGICLIALVVTVISSIVIASVAGRKENNKRRQISAPAVQERKFQVYDLKE